MNFFRFINYDSFEVRNHPASSRHPSEGGELNCASEKIVAIGDH